MNTVNFSEIQATSPQLKGTTGKRVQINEPSVSSDTMMEKDNNPLQGGTAMQPARLFEADLGDLLPEQKELLNLFDPVDKDRKLPAHLLTADNLDSEGVHMTLDMGKKMGEVVLEVEGHILDVEIGDKTEGLESADASELCRT